MEQPGNFLENIHRGMSREVFALELEKVMSEDDRSVLGDAAAEVVAKALRFSAIFPSDFDLEGFKAVADLPEEEARRVLDIVTREGLMSISGDRYSVVPEVHPILDELLDELPGE